MDFLEIAGRFFAPEPPEITLKKILLKTASGRSAENKFDFHPFLCYSYR